MSRVTLPERLFSLHDADDVDRFLARWSTSVVFKAGTSDKTIDAWAVAQHALEPRADVAVGFVRLPDDRAASDRVSALADIAHRSPQVILFQHARALCHLDEFAIVPDGLVPLLREYLPAEVGSPVRNDAVVTLEPYRLLLSQFVRGDLPEARFQWGYLDRLAKEAAWRDDETFALLNALFENERGRDVRPASIVAVEFQGQLAGRLEPLTRRAAQMLDRLAGR
jgi:hypothetical protein